MATISEMPVHPGLVRGRSAQPTFAPGMPTGTFNMYAIAFDLDTEMLKQHYPNDSYNNGYADIKKLLTTKHHFKWQQGSVYFGDPEKVTAVTCVLAAMDLARTFVWFAPSVKDIRMLRIEEANDLMAAVQQAIE
jgi:virulence-associated protein VapD